MCDSVVHIKLLRVYVDLWQGTGFMIIIIIII